jgi:hypothetical protein
MLAPTFKNAFWRDGDIYAMYANCYDGGCILKDAITQFKNA